MNVEDVIKRSTNTTYAHVSFCWLVLFKTKTNMKQIFIFYRRIFFGGFLGSSCNNLAVKCYWATAMWWFGVSVTQAVD